MFASLQPVKRATGSESTTCNSSPPSSLRPTCCRNQSWNHRCFKMKSTAQKNLTFFFPQPSWSTPIPQPGTPSIQQAPTIALGTCAKQGPGKLPIGLQKRALRVLRLLCPTTSRNGLRCLVALTSHIPSSPLGGKLLMAMRVLTNEVGKKALCRRRSLTLERPRLWRGQAW